MVHPRVLAIVAARNGARHLPSTLPAIAAQSRPIDLLVAVDASSTDASKQMLIGAEPTHVVSVAARASFGASVRAALAALPEAEEGDWLWLLAHDAAPHERALERMLGSVETSPSVVMVGPKVMRAAEPQTIAEYGETLTPFGASVRLHQGELDQGQHDAVSDAMGVAASGLLVRRDVFEVLGGFDPALPSIDAGLDLGVRARLAGHRVALQPDARVRADGGPELFSSRAVSGARRTAIARRAQLHRRLVYANPVAAVLLWLATLPLAVGHAIAQLFAKRPSSAVAELTAGLGAFVSLGHVMRARRRIARSRKAPWSSLASLRLSWRDLREHRRLASDDDVPYAAREADERVGFIEGGALWVTALAAIASVILSMRLIGGTAATGGALLRLDASIGGVWANALWSEHGLPGGVSGPADPFGIVIALLGSLTFWSPSLAVTITFFALMPLAAITGWFAVRRLTRSKWAPTVGAVVWAFAPTLLVAVHEGRIGAAIAHVLLPVVLAGLLRAHRSWSGAAVASLAMAGAAAGAPSLIPALIVVWAASLAIGWRAARRILVVPVPMLVLLLPLALQHLQRGSLVDLLADPGVPLATRPGLATDLGLWMPDGGLAGWESTARWLGLGIDGGWMAFALAVPLLVLAVIGLVARPAPAAAAVGAALLGFGTAVLASRLELASDGAQSVGVWTGAGVSLALLGVLAAAAIAIEALDFRAGVPVALAVLTALVVAVPMVATPFTTGAVVTQAADRRLPAFITAAAAVDPDIGTLVITPLDAGTVQVKVERGSGSTLDDVATISTTREEPDEIDGDLAEAAVNLMAAGDADPSSLLDELGIGYVVLAEAGPGGEQLHDRGQRSLEQRGDLDGIGQTDAGLLWVRAEVPPGVGPTGPPFAPWLLWGQLVVLLAAALIALPSTRRGARRLVRGRTKLEDWA